MRQTYKDIPGDMCDFHDYYRAVAISMPKKCRLVEVGVADGHSAIYLAETLSDLGKDFHLYMIDSLDYGKLDQANTIIRNIIRSGLGDRITFIQMGSLDASCLWPDNWAHFVFIDASHKYEQTKADIRLWYRKVMDGYYLAGHDMNQRSGNEVWSAVRETLPSMHTVVETPSEYGIWQVEKHPNRLPL